MFNHLHLIKGSCRARIYEFYPLEKQININNLQGYTQEQKDTMWTFINACRLKSNQLEQEENLSTEDIDYSDITPNGN